MTKDFREKFDNFIWVWFISVITIIIVLAISVGVFNAIQEYRFKEKLCDEILYLKKERE